jgi:nucleoside 2-deoxyribosyltransferase
MKVHLITSRPTLENDMETLRRIISFIESRNHSLAVNWIEEARKRSKGSEGQNPDWAWIFKNNLETIAKADVIVAETSYENFGVGYQVAVAVQQKKPVLMLRHKDADKNAFATGVEDGWVKRAEYTENDLEDILDKFLEANDIQAKDMRFNFFIDRPIYNYLRWAAFKTGKTKAEILRELVVREIDKSNDPR